MWRVLKYSRSVAVPWAGPRIQILEFYGVSFLSLSLAPHTLSLRPTLSSVSPCLRRSRSLTPSHLLRLAPCPLSLSRSLSFSLQVCLYFCLCLPACLFALSLLLIPVRPSASLHVKRPAHPVSLSPAVVSLSRTLYHGLSLFFLGCLLSSLCLRGNKGLSLRAHVRGCHNV